MSINTKFADMPQPVRNQWLAWANSHDWGGAAAKFFTDMDDRVYLVASFAVWMDGPNGGWTTEDCFAETPKALRDEAGY